MAWLYDVPDCLMTEAVISCPEYQNMAGFSMAILLMGAFGAPFITFPALVIVFMWVAGGLIDALRRKAEAAGVKNRHQGTISTEDKETNP